MRFEHAHQNTTVVIVPFRMAWIDAVCVDAVRVMSVVRASARRRPLLELVEVIDELPGRSGAPLIDLVILEEGLFEGRRERRASAGADRADVGLRADVIEHRLADVVKHCLYRLHSLRERLVGQACHRLLSARSAWAKRCRIFSAACAPPRG